MTSSAFEPATFWLVAWCLNQLRCRVPTTIILVSDTTNRKKRFYVYLIRSIKQYSLGGFSVGISEGNDV
jgi:hypothetical protein